MMFETAQLAKYLGSTNAEMGEWYRSSDPMGNDVGRGIMSDEAAGVHSLAAMAGFVSRLETVPEDDQVPPKAGAQAPAQGMASLGGYKDQSKTVDPDPLSPITAPGRVANFPAKLHAILARRDLSHIITWLPHGRAWTVLRPREFEADIIPQYFGHSKLSSFVRQANGWGFRRLTQGPDRNGYYHEMFLRGLPHLCKTMKRPGKSYRKYLDPNEEPDLYKLSAMYPLPDAPNQEAMHQMQLTLGPTTRMPIYTGLGGNDANSGGTEQGTAHSDATVVQPETNQESATKIIDQTGSYSGMCHVIPKPNVGVDQQNLAFVTSTTPGVTIQQAQNSFYQNHMCTASGQQPHQERSQPQKQQYHQDLQQQQQQQQGMLNFPDCPPESLVNMTTMPHMMMMMMGASAAAAGNRSTNNDAPSCPMEQMMSMQAQFAAGFAAAVAFSQQHFGQLLQSAASTGSSTK